MIRSLTDAMGALKIADIGHDIPHISLRDAWNRRHVAKRPVVADNTLAYRAKERRIRMVARFIELVDKRRSPDRTHHVRPMANCTIGGKQMGSGLHIFD